jgi:hypothetical protein
MNECQIIEEFYKTLFSSANEMRTPYRKDLTPPEMMNSPVSEDGWFTWKAIPGTLRNESYHEVERKFKVIFPESFIEWHKKYYFLNCGTNLVNLPYSYPNKPLDEVIENLDYDFAKDLIAFKLYPFASDGNDGGVWAFDGRVKLEEK